MLNSWTWNICRVSVGGCTRMHTHPKRTCVFLSFERLFLLQRWHVAPWLQQYPASMTAPLLNSKGGMMAGRSAARRYHVNLYTTQTLNSKYLCLSVLPGAWTNKKKCQEQHKGAQLFLRRGSKAASGGIGEGLPARMWGVWGHGQPASLCHTQGTDSRQWGRAELQYIYTSPFPLTPALSSQRRRGINTDIGVGWGGM